MMRITVFGREWGAATRWARRSQMMYRLDRFLVWAGNHRYARRFATTMDVLCFAFVVYGVAFIIGPALLARLGGG